MYNLSVYFTLVKTKENMSEKHHRDKSKDTNPDSESHQIDKELLELITKNESFKKGITKLVEEIDRDNNKEQNL